MTTSEEWVPQDDGSDQLYQGGRPTCIKRWPAETQRVTTVRVVNADDEEYTRAEFDELLDELRVDLDSLGAVSIAVVSIEIQALHIAGAEAIPLQ